MIKYCYLTRPTSSPPWGQNYSPLPIARLVCKDTVSAEAVVMLEPDLCCLVNNIVMWGKDIADKVVLWRYQTSSCVLVFSKVDRLNQNKVPMEDSHSGSRSPSEETDFDSRTEEKNNEYTWSEFLCLQYWMWTTHLEPVSQHSLLLQTCTNFVRDWEIESINVSLAIAIHADAILWLQQNII